MNVATVEDVERIVTNALARTGPPRLALTVPETAKSLGTSPDTVRRLIRAGHLPVVPHMGTRQLIPVAALHEFVSAGASTSAGDGLPSPSSAGVDGPADSIGATPAGSSGSVSPLRPQRVSGPRSTARGGPTTPAA